MGTRTISQVVKRPGCEAPPRTKFKNEWSCTSTPPWPAQGLLYLLTSGASNLADLYTGCPRRNVRDFGRVFLMLNYTGITQKTYIQS